MKSKGNKILLKLLALGLIKMVLLSVVIDIDDSVSTSSSEKYHSSHQSDKSIRITFQTTNCYLKSKPILFQEIQRVFGQERSGTKMIIVRL